MKVVENPKYRGIKKEFIFKKINEVLRHYSKKKLNSIKNVERSKIIKEIVKKVRSELRNDVTLYLLNMSNSSNIEEVLNNFKSTKERYNYIFRVYSRIFSFLKEHKIKLKKIIDLGCGLNPLSFLLYYIYSNESFGIINYYCYDVNEIILDKVRDIVNGIKKKNSKVKEIRFRFINEDISQIKNFPKGDLVFLFKILHIIDKKNHKNSEELLKKIDSSALVISFSIRTLSGKPMRFKRRTWLEKMLTRLNYRFSYEIIGKEIFYFVTKK